MFKEALLALLQQGIWFFHFAEARSGKPVKDIAVSRRVSDLAKAAGLRLMMKELRKGVGCRYAGKVSAHVLQWLIHHADFKTTLAYYVNIDTAVEEAASGRSVTVHVTAWPTRTPFRARKV